MTKAEPRAELVLVLAPTGRDAELTRDVLATGGIACALARDIEELAQGIAAGAGATLIAEEALMGDGLDALAAALERQAPWSDVPILVAASEGGARTAHEHIRRRMPRPGSVTILERPIPSITLVTALGAALRARQRQYERRDLMAELRAKVDALEVERRVRARFVAILAHDLRGPLSATKLTAELLASDTMSSDRRRDLSLRAAGSLDRMDRMLRDLLDIHRIQAGRGLPLHLERLDLGDLARSAADELNATYGDRIVLRAAQTIEGIWSSDELRRSIWNLCTNAMKYGAAEVPIELTIGGSDGGAYVSVHNHGPPIPPEEQTDLFEPFGRTRNASVSKDHGWGLGLALVRGCAEAHGGTADVESLPDEGTTFTIWLPWDARPSQAPDATEVDGGDRAQPP